MEGKRTLLIQMAVHLLRTFFGSPLLSVVALRFPGIVDVMSKVKAVTLCFSRQKRACATELGLQKSLVSRLTRLGCQEFAHPQIMTI